MRRLGNRTSFSVGLLAILLFATPRVGADTPFLTGAGSAFASSGAFTLGYKFTVGADPIRLTALGVWDEGSDGLNAAHAVGIWNSTGSSLLASVNASAGASGTLVDGYRFTSLSSTLDLAANTTYVVGAAYNGDDVARNIAPFTSPTRADLTSPGITINFGEFEFGSSLTFPSGDVSSTYNGPNGLFTSVPEPICAVSLVALAALAIGRRRHA